MMREKNWDLSMPVDGEEDVCDSDAIQLPVRKGAMQRHPLRRALHLDKVVLSSSPMSNPENLTAQALADVPPSTDFLRELLCLWMLGDCPLTSPRLACVADGRQFGSMRFQVAAA